MTLPTDAGSGLLAHDRHLGLDVERVVGADLAAEAVLQRRDDAAAVGVVLRVGAGDEHHVERQADLVAADLHVALFEHVEQADLDALGEVGDLVDGEDAAVGARHQAVVQRQLVAEVAALGHLDRIDLADEVGDRRVGRGQLLAEAVVAMHPVDRRGVAHLGDEIAGVLADRLVRIVVDLAAGDDRHPLVEQTGERADDARLGLAALAEEDHVVAGEQGVLELRHDRLLVAEHAFEQRLAGGDLGDRVAPDLFLHGRRLPARGLQFAEGVSECCHGSTIPLFGGARPGPSLRLVLADVDLSGQWRANVADDERRRSAVGLDYFDDDWPEVEVPGHWRNSPTFADNDEPLIYRQRFDLEPAPAGRRHFVTLDGVFYQADVWLDGAYLGDPEGYFFPHTFDITSLSRLGERARAGRRGGLPAAAQPQVEAQHHRRVPELGRDGPDVEPRRPVAPGADRHDRAGAHRPVARAVPRRQRHPRPPAPARPARQRRGQDACGSARASTASCSTSTNNRSPGASTRSTGTSTSTTRGCGGRGRSASSR